MSWRASAWAKEQRLGSPAAKSILLCLADYADPDKAECWPSQTQLAADAEVSERTAREWLQRLEEWGLISRERRSRANGARASDMIMLKLDARVRDGVERCRDMRAGEAAGDAGGEGEAVDLPAEIAGRAYRQSDAEPTGNQAQPTGNGCRGYKEEPPIEPSSGTSQPRQGAREEDLDRNSKERIERAFWRTIKGWPGFDAMPKEPAKRAWFKLTDEEREAAEAKLPAWKAMLSSAGWKNTPAPSKYFGEKLWQAVPDVPEAPPVDLDAPAFGKLWSAVRLKMLLTPPQASPPLTPVLAQMSADDPAVAERVRLQQQQRYGWPRVNGLHEGATNRRGIRVAAGSPVERLAELMEPVPVGSAMFKAWEAEHERRGWPWLPEPGRQPVVYFPAGGPDGLRAFEVAMRGEQRGEGDDAGRSEAAE